MNIQTLTAAANPANLLAAAEQAAAEYDWETALGYYSRGLEQPDLRFELAHRLRLGRARAYEYLGRFAEQLTDLESALAQAEASGDPETRLQTRLRLAEYYWYRDQQRLEANAAAARALARTVQAPAAEVDATRLLAGAAYRQGDPARANELLIQALDRARQIDDPHAEANVLTVQANLAYNANHPLDQVIPKLERALALYKQTGDRYRQGAVLVGLGNACTDLALKRSYQEKAARLAEEMGHIPRQVNAANNLAFLFWGLGLYHRAEALIQQVIERGRETGQVSPVHLMTLAECYLPLGKYDLIPPLVEKTRRLAHQTGNHELAESYTSFILGLTALARGEPEAARAHLEIALENIDTGGPHPGFEPTNRAWLGAALLAAGDVDAALAQTRLAAATEEPLTFYPAQEIWWWHYRCLTAAAGGGSPPPAARAALEHAYELTQAAIANLSDEGLRRNYLNKVPINRDIVLAWVRLGAGEAPARPAAPARAGSPSGLAEQVQRLVAIGNRLTAVRDPDLLPEMIRDEFVELSGAERAIVALRAEDGTLSRAAALNNGRENTVPGPDKASRLLEEVQATWQPRLQPSIGTVPPGAAPALHLRSAIALPLVSQGKLWGVLYGDMRHVFGQFSATDLDLLSLLANQAAAALENAAWSQGLEQQVAARTAELNARVSELRIINSVQAGLASKLEMDAIFELVGDKIWEITGAQIVVINTIDHDREMIHYKYVREKSVRLEITPRKLTSLNKYVISQNGTVVIQENLEALLNAFEYEIPAGEMPKSTVVVPLFIGGEYAAAISLQDADRENAFSEADIRLLETLANSMSVALENARLFTTARQARAEAEAARRAAEEANQAKSIFLANMSHELRTPLNAIVGFTRIVRRKGADSLPEKQLDNLDKVLVSSEHLLGLINTVLDIAKIEAGRMDVLPGEFEFPPLAELALSTSQPLVDRGVSLAAEIQPGIPPLYTDQDKVRQILLNLLSNAAKFTHSGQITLQAGADNGSLWVNVIDTGIGIPADKLNKIFEEFQQVDSSTTRQYGGTGLGLSISKQLALLLGGDLTAASRPGAGSTFSLLIPLSYQPPQTETTAPGADPDQSPGPEAQT